MTRGRYDVLVATPTGEVEVVATKARELGRKAAVVGDVVELVGDVSGRDGSLARIVRVAPRRTVLRRSADDADAIERVIVANADQLVVVTALADPEPRTRMIDRCLVAAYDAGMGVLLCLTKSDLADPEELLGMYRPLGVEAVATSIARPPNGGPDSRREVRGLDALAARLAGRTSVLIGHSGVGKSTLVNALIPGAARATGHVNATTGRGRHTSTQAVSLRLPDGGWVVDTPGVRSFGLAHVDPGQVIAAFPDLEEVTRECPRGCTHLETEPECALDAWAEPLANEAPQRARLDSFRRLLRSRLGVDDAGEAASGSVRP